MQVDYQESDTEAVRRLLAAHPTDQAMPASYRPFLAPSASAWSARPRC